MENTIVNRVAHSNLISFDLADHHSIGDRVILDIKDQLFMGQILREKDYRAWIEGTDWSQYSGKHILLTCSSDAILPGWAFPLLTTVLQPFASTLVYGSSMQDLETAIFREALNKVDFSQFQDKKVVIKGCGDIEVPTAVYVDLTARLRPFAEKIMYGEPCSSVPLFKKKLRTL